MNACGIEIDYETRNDFVCMCPFHGNKYTPSFSVSKLSGEFICFNGACMEFGGLLELVKLTQHKNDFEAARIINQAKKSSVLDFKERLQNALAKPVEFEKFSQEVIDVMKSDFWNHPQAVEYMRSRGFDDDILEEYGVGFSFKRNLITVPMHDINGMPIGVIGRSIGDSKIFKNSRGLPVSKTLWNLHRAKRTGDTAIVVEASFDGMATAQAGYPNVVACLGGHFSESHKEQLDKYFNTIIIATDFDDKEKHRYVGCRKCDGNCVGHNPGRALGESIAQQLSNKKILWGAYDYKVIYPNGAKDPNSMTDAEIRQFIKNSVSNYEYHSWHIEK